ncbi:MAG TPA: CPBP family intramembrane glutamic endopeptidase [Terriglobales bacterium]
MDANLRARSPFPTRALVEVSLGYALIVVTIWSPMPERNYIGMAAAAWISGALLFSGLSDEERGFGVRQLWRAKWPLAIALLIAAVGLFVAAQVGTLHLRQGTTGYKPPMVGYLVWSLVQQVILQLFLVPRLIALLRSFWGAVLAAAIMFSAAHLPNPLLTLATLIWGIGACWLFWRYKSVLVVALIHFMLGACLALSVPAPVHRNMRVGLGYLHYRAPARAQLPSPRNAVFATPAHGANSR